jgi:predicted enzyme related to lactoylglutathione lyase
MPDGRRPALGGWNRIHFLVDDIESEISRLQRGGGDVTKRHRHWPRRLAVVAEHPSGNVVELFQPRGWRRSASTSTHPARRAWSSLPSQARLTC